MPNALAKASANCAMLRGLPNSAMASTLKKPARKRALKSKLKREQIERLYATLARLDPAPKTELAFVNPYTLLVAVVLSAQATDKGVNTATRALFQTVQTPAAMVTLGEDGLADHIRTIGLWRAKAKNVIALSRQLLERHDGAVPNDRAALEALPGVGRKTASVVLLEAFGEPAIAVDTHVFRVANRTGLAPAPTPDAVEDILMAVTPPEYLSGAHHWLILHGRYVCVTRKPKCGNCAIADLCKFKGKIGIG
jgi:endonuclease-3